MKHFITLHINADQINHIINVTPARPAVVSLMGYESMYLLEMEGDVLIGATEKQRNRKVNPRLEKGADMETGYGEPVTIQDLSLVIGGKWCYLGSNQPAARELLATMHELCPREALELA